MPFMRMFIVAASAVCCSRFVREPPSPIRKINRRLARPLVLDGGIFIPVGSTPAPTAARPGSRWNMTWSIHNT